MFLEISLYRLLHLLPVIPSRRDKMVRVRPPEKPLHDHVRRKHLNRLAEEFHVFFERKYFHFPAGVHLFESPSRGQREDGGILSRQSSGPRKSNRARHVLPRFAGKPENHVAADSYAAPFCPFHRVYERRGPVSAVDAFKRRVVRRLQAVLDPECVTEASVSRSATFHPARSPAAFLSQDPRPRAGQAPRGDRLQTSDRTRVRVRLEIGDELPRARPRPEFFFPSSICAAMPPPLAGVNAELSQKTHPPAEIFPSRFGHVKPASNGNLVKPFRASKRRADMS